VVEFGVMVVVIVDEDGWFDVCMVLFKGLLLEGFMFYMNICLVKGY